jgi:phosphohistidine phosphatase
MVLLRELYLLRHGLAGQYGDPQYKDDSLRPLTLEGRQKMRKASKGMKNLGLKFDLILSSPYLRALQTAQIVAETYKIKTKEIVLTDKLLPPASAHQLVQEITKRFPKKQYILTVGHEPHLTQIISELLKSDQHLNIDFKKGGLVSLSLPQPLKSFAAKFNWLLTSNQLGLITREKQ